MRKPDRIKMLIIVPAGIVNASNNDAKGWDALGGEFTFTSELTNNPRGVTVAYWAETRCNMDECEIMKSTVLQRGSIKAWCVDVLGDNSALKTLFAADSNVVIGEYNPEDILTAENLRRKVVAI